MADRLRSKAGLPNFRATLHYLRRHLRPLLLGMLAAVGVSLFYTFSISSIVPLLKVVFADHETLASWLHRSETQRRLDVIIAADMPDDPAGLIVSYVDEGSPNAGVLQPGDRLVAVEGRPGSAYALMERLAVLDGQRAAARVLRVGGGPAADIELQLKPPRWWSRRLGQIAGLLPGGKDPGSRLRTLGLVMAALVAVTLAGGLCRLANEGLIATAVQRALHDLRSELAEHVLRLPMSWHVTHPPGDTLGRFATDISKVEVGMTTLFGRALREPLKAAGVLALTVMIDWRLLIVAGLGLPIGLLVMGLFGRLVKRQQRRASESWGRLLDHLNEKIAGIRVVKSYGCQEAESRRFEREGRVLTRAQTRIELIEAGTKPVLELLAMLGVSAFVMYGANRVFNQQLEPHLFFAALVCLGGIFDPIRKLGKVNNRLQAAEASARRLLELREAQTEDQAAAERARRALGPLRESIVFENVSFAYPSNPQRLVLEDVSLRIARGQVVALVGPNGSGKTTLMSLLLRFYEPTAGRILIDGVDIAEVTLDSLRRQIGLVTQDAVVFADTVRANIAYGCPEADDEAVRQAARRAHIDEFVSTLTTRVDGRVLAGYDAWIDPRSLSGGQRQRIALARAILRDPAILILDEATSQVDSESERDIQQAIADVSRGRTMFIIAHRYSTIARADLTVVLNEGRVVSVGRHDELLESCPFYGRLCRTQFAET